jgi:hypothetical protein
MTAVVMFTGLFIEPANAAGSRVYPFCRDELVFIEGYHTGKALQCGSYTQEEAAARAVTRCR